MGEADAVARPPADRAWLEAEQHRIEERQIQIDRRRARYDAMGQIPQAWLRRFRENLDALAAERDRVAAEWDRLAAGRDEAARIRDAQAGERNRAASAPDADLAGITRGASTRAERDRTASRRDREAAREDRERSALDRARAADDRARAERMRDEQAAIEERVTAAVAALDVLISAEEEAELAHRLALLEQLALTETDRYRLGQLLRQAEQERRRAESAGKRAEHTRAQVSELPSSIRPIVPDLSS